MTDTHGIPLDILLDVFDSKNLVVDWIDFYEQSTKSGWKLKTIIEKVKYPLIDVYGEDYSNKIVEKITNHSKGLQYNGIISDLHFEDRGSIPLGSTN